MYLNGFKFRHGSELFVTASAAATSKSLRLWRGRDDMVRFRWRELMMPMLIIGGVGGNHQYVWWWWWL
jgi:hypothetical protein